MFLSFDFVDSPLSNKAPFFNHLFRSAQIGISPPGGLKELFYDKGSLCAGSLGSFKAAAKKSKDSEFIGGKDFLLS